LLASAIGSLLQDQEKALNFGDAARQRFEQNFSLEATAKPLLDLVAERAG
jgi:hypothetical protein